MGTGDMYTIKAFFTRISSCYRCGFLFDNAFDIRDALSNPKQRNEMGSVIKKSEELWLVGARSRYRPADRQYIDEGAARVSEQNEQKKINLVIDALGREDMREGKEGIKKVDVKEGVKVKGEFSTSFEDRVNRSPRFGWNWRRSIPIWSSMSVYDPSS